MTDLLLLQANNTDAHCPPLTVPTVKDDGVGCVYTNWAYALFAAVALIIVAIPFVAFICYVQRRVKNKHRARALAHSTSYESSGAYPYQVGLITLQPCVEQSVFMFKKRIISASCIKSKNLQPSIAGGCGVLSAVHLCAWVKRYGLFLKKNTIVFLKVKLLAL